MRRSLVPALIVFAMLVAACTSSTPEEPTDTAAAPAEGTIKIGIEGPMTGSQSVTGIDMFNAATMAVDEANANGGIMGMQIELVRLDDAADPEKGKEVAEQAVADGLFAVVGPYNSSVGIENLDIYLEGGVIPIHLTSTQATDGKGFTVQPKDYQVAPVESAAITGWLKADDVAILFDPSEYTSSIATQVNRDIRKEGGNISFTRRVIPDFPAPILVKQVDQAKADLAYASTYFPEGSKFAAAAEGRMKAQCFMGLANQDPEFIERAGLAASRACNFSGVPSPDQFPNASEYVTAYQERFSLPPGTWGPFVHDSFTMLFAAVDEAGGWDHDAVDEILKGTTDYEGLTGPITIDPETGNRTNVPIVILRVNNAGAFIINPGWARWAGFPLN